MELHLPCLEKVGKGNNGYKTIEEFLLMLTVAALVVGARPVLFPLRLRIGTAEVVWVLGPPQLVGLTLLLLATVWLERRKKIRREEK